MQQYYLKITSKNEKSLEHFLHFFYKHLKTKFNIIQKSVSIENKRKIITLLKSPHVNKTAQEHFEVRIFTKHVFLKSFSVNKNLIFLKKILNKLFQDVSIRLELITNKSVNQKSNRLIFYPDNFRLFSNKQFKTNTKRYKRKHVINQLYLQKKSLFNLTKFLKIISVFSEMLILSTKIQ